MIRIDGTSRSPRVPRLLAMLAAFGLLLLDVAVPQGILDGYPYFVVVLFSLSEERPCAPYGYAAIAMALAFTGFLLSDEANIGGRFDWRIGLANCVVAAALFGVMAVMLHKYKRATALLAADRESLARANHEKVKLLSVISHDLKSPLQAMTTFAHLVAGTAPAGGQRGDYAHLLMVQVQRVTDLVDTATSWGRAQMANRPAAALSDLAALASSAVETARGAALIKGVDLRLDAAPALAVVDAPGIEVVLRNLLSNAVKFTPEGGSVTVRVTAGTAQAVVEVVDTGVGIPPERIPTLFALSENQSTEGTAGEGGTGLGLPLSQELVQRNGGSLSVSSSAEGTVVTLSLPSAGGVTAAPPASVARAS
ncbi:sensor histidine kinase [Azospirillum sp.]|uniref:sensor histidine kinase n=1 Tax=Azospirillum sp. TaxID=34012 RepID=UPI003D7398FF